MSTPPTILLTGATGFVGGTILTTLTTNLPHIHIKALFRDSSTATELQTHHPNLTPIIGDLSNLPLLTRTSAECDFVIHAAGDNADAVCAMIDGLASRNSGDAAPRLISITGPRSLIDPNVPITGSKTKGRAWSDVADIETISSLPGERMHAGTDQAILAHSKSKGVGTMLVSPGQLFGQGKGSLKKESSSALYYSLVQSRAKAFMIGEGSATWSWTSIGDFGSVVSFLVSRSLDPATSKAVDVNEEGYYFVRTADVSMRERAEAVSERLGLGHVESLTVEQAREMHPFGPIMWGCGERTRADRLEALGWAPKEKDWRALMEEEGGGRA